MSVNNRLEIEAFNSYLNKVHDFYPKKERGGLKRFVCAINY